MTINIILPDSPTDLLDTKQLNEIDCVVRAAHTYSHAVRRVCTFSTLDLHVLRQCVVCCVFNWQLPRQHSHFMRPTMANLIYIIVMLIYIYSKHFVSVRLCKIE